MNRVCSRTYKFYSQPRNTRAFRIVFNSTEARNPSTLRSTSAESLFVRISPVEDSNVSIVPVLDQWIKEGKTISKRELQLVIKRLRDHRRYNHALQVSHWMSDHRSLDLSTSDIAVRLRLIAEVHGLEKAEEYFDNIPKQLRSLSTYTVLLNCYRHHKSMEKAEDHMQKMRDLGFVMSSASYNVLMNLYYQLGQHEKLNFLFQEMEQKGILPDKYTFSILLGSFVATLDIKGMEKTLQRMETEPKVFMDWDTYAVAANGYIKAGFIDKALEMLKKSEEQVTVKNNSRTAVDFFLTLYSKTGKKDEVYRIWNQNKTSEKVYSSTYLSMISSLLKLDDIEGAEKIIADWESSGTANDFHVPNLLLAAYCKRCLWGKAQEFINKVTENGKKPHPSTWDCLATGYFLDNQMPKALEAMEKAIMECTPGWKPNCSTLVACLEYLKAQGDTEVAEGFIRSLRTQGTLPSNVCDELQKYLEDGELKSDTLHEIIRDAFGDSEGGKPQNEIAKVAAEV